MSDGARWDELFDYCEVLEEQVQALTRRVSVIEATGIKTPAGVLTTTPYVDQRSYTEDQARLAKARIDAAIMAGNLKPMEGQRMKAHVTRRTLK